MNKLLEEYQQQHAFIQLLTRQGLGVEGQVVRIEGDWIILKQTKPPATGTLSAVRLEEVIMIHRPPEVPIIQVQPRGLQVS